MSGESFTGEQRGDGARTHDEVRSISVRYHLVLGLVALLVIAGVSLFTVRSVSAQRASDRATIEQRLRLALTQVEAQVQTGRTHVADLAQAVGSATEQPDSSDASTIDELRAALPLAPPGLPHLGMAAAPVERLGSPILRDNSVIDEPGLQAAAAFLPIARATRGRTSFFQWTYIYDVAARFTWAYPAVDPSIVVGPSSTPTSATTLDALLDADDSRPLELVGPGQNPEREVRLSTPYLDAGGTGLMVSVLAPIDVNGRYSAVAGTDIHLAALTALIAGDRGSFDRLAIIGSNGEMLADTRPQGATDHIEHASTSFPAAAPALADEDGVMLASNPGAIVSLPVEGTTWRLVGLVGSSGSISAFSKSIIAAVLLVTVLLALLVVIDRQIARPALRLADYTLAIHDDRIETDPPDVGRQWRGSRRALVELARQRRQTIEELNAANRRLQSILSRSQAELVRSERQSSVVSLLSAVTSAIANPLGNSDLAIDTMRSRVDELTEDRPEHEEIRAVVRDGTGMALDEHRKAISLLRRMSHVARNATREEPQTFDLATVTEHAAWVMERRFRHAAVSLDVQVEPDLELYGPPGALTQVLVNLLTNALDHGVRVTDGAKVGVTARRDPNRTLTIEVSDNGAGMSSETAATAFDLFGSDSRDGGLGLYIVRDVVEREFGGTVALRSRPGEGTTALIRLPERAADGAVERSKDTPHA